jgi:hypothetical protein
LRISFRIGGSCPPPIPGTVQGSPSEIDCSELEREFRAHDTKTTLWGWFFAFNPLKTVYKAHFERKWVFLRLKRQIVTLRRREKMIASLREIVFPKPKQRAIVILHRLSDNKLYVLVHDNHSLFHLQKKESVATAARFILRQGFAFVTQDIDIHVQDKYFELDGVEYHLVKFDGPLLVEQDVDGYQKLEEEGFTFIMVGDHPLSPKINKAMGRT